MTPDENVIEAVRAAKDAEKGSVWKEVKRGKIRWARSKILNCTYDNSAGINGEVTAKLNLTFPTPICTMRRWQSCQRL